ncbi:hypothetical protein EI94DRAFT_1752340 [Lactarius quietus]|nr:hypothetical protein EI94DRAFT_1752340 [Lactarius quietus]
MEMTVRSCLSPTLPLVTGPQFLSHCNVLAQRYLQYCLCLQYRNTCRRRESTLLRMTPGIAK